MATEDWFGIVTIRIQRPSTRNWVTAWPQGREGARERLEGFCQVLEEALSIARKDLDRLILARELMNRVTKECRSNSKLPELVDLFLSRPLVTTCRTMVQSSACLGWA